MKYLLLASLAFASIASAVPPLKALHLEVSSSGAHSRAQSDTQRLLRRKSRRLILEIEQAREPIRPRNDFDGLKFNVAEKAKRVAAPKPTKTTAQTFTTLTKKTTTTTSAPTTTEKTKGRKLPHSQNAEW